MMRQLRLLIASKGKISTPRRRRSESPRTAGACRSDDELRQALAACFFALFKDPIFVTTDAPPESAFRLALFLLLHDLRPAVLLALRLFRPSGAAAPCALPSLVLSPLF